MCVLTSSDCSQCLYWALHRYDLQQSDYDPRLLMAPISYWLLEEYATLFSITEVYHLCTYAFPLPTSHSQQFLLRKSSLF